MRTPLILLGLTLTLTACGNETPPRAAEPPPAPTTTTAPTARPAADPSATPTRTPPPARPVVPDVFPLADGYPPDERAEGDDGLQTPNRRQPPLDLSPCDRVVTPVGHTDLVRAGWCSVEDYRDRQLVTFAGRDEASSYVEAIVAAHRACPREPDELTVALTAVRETDLGDQGIVLSRRFESHEGWPAVGLVTTHVVRVGSAVLLASTSNEGGAGPDPDAQAAEQIEVDAEAIVGVVDAMADL